MAQSLSNVILHLIFSTKERYPWLYKDIRIRLHAYLAETVRKQNCDCLRVGGIEDHVHLALRLARTMAIANLVKEVKSYSTKWLKMQGGSLRDFSWQGGYGVFSLGVSQQDILLEYINNQEKHHQRVSFQDEYREFLIKYKINFDEEHIWN